MWPYVWQFGRDSPRGSAGQADSSCLSRQPGEKPYGHSNSHSRDGVQHCPQLAVTRERHHRRWLHSLHGCTGSRTTGSRLWPHQLRLNLRAPLRLAPAASGRPLGGPAAAGIPGSLAGRPAGQPSRKVVRRQRIRRDRGTDRRVRRDHSDRSLSWWS